MFKSYMLKSFVTILIVNTVFLSLAHAENSINPMYPRHCYSCTGINCFRTSMVEVNTTCTDILDICVTIFDEYAVAAKGCYLDMPEQLRNKCNERNNPECYKCFGELCNNVGRADFKCIECNSNDNAKCSEDTTAMTAVQCSIPTAPNSYCYVKKTEGAGQQRGCLTHVKDQQNCLKDDGCSMCLLQDGEACNSYKLSENSGATRTIVLNLSAILTLIATVFLR